MRVYVLAAAFAACLSSPIAAADDAGFSRVVNAAPHSSSEVMRTIGLDRLFAQFGQTMAASPRQQGVTDERFLGAWEGLALKAFSRTELNAQLEAVLTQSLDAGELSDVDLFLLSPFGLRVTLLEQATQTIGPEQQIAAIAKGQTLYFVASGNRQGQIEELLELSGAELTFAMLGESIRGMAVGLHLSSHGDLDVPWTEIDAGVQTQLAGMQQSLAEATRGALAYTYDPLSDAELEAYLDFLRRPATRKFYEVTTLAVGAIIREAMFTLGEDLAARLARVEI